MISKKDLLRLNKDDLAGHLDDFLNTLSPGKRGKWARENIPELLKTGTKTKKSAGQLLNDIENFTGESRSGSYVSWISEGHYYQNYEEEDDYSNIEEWTANFTDLLTRTLKVSQLGKHKIAAECFKKLFSLLSEASRTTDILGNQGPPMNYIKADFSQVIAIYTRSLLELKGKDKLQEVLDTVMPLAKKFNYLGGYRRLVSALDSDGRKILSERLWKVTRAEWKEHNQRTSPDEVDGLISIAEAEGDKKQALSIKERFAKANASYLKDILNHYQRKRDWKTVGKWAKVGLTHFGQHKEYVLYLIKAKENLGDKEAVLDTKIEYFLEYPAAGEFADIRKYAGSISKWDNVLEMLVTSAGNYARQGYPGLEIKLLLAIGREKDTLEWMGKKKDRLEIEDIKFIAKYGLARASSGLSDGRGCVIVGLWSRWRRR